MKYLTITVVLLIVLFSISNSKAQSLEVEGIVKVGHMNESTETAKIVTRESDGTLTQKSGGQTYSIGDFAHGGVVFWVTAEGAHGKVVSIYNIDSVFWAVNENVVAAKSEDNGAGNTAACLAFPDIVNAAETCGQYSYMGYDDWYLPSKNELNEIYLNLNSISATSLSFGGESSFDGWYWSSTVKGRVSQLTVEVWAQDMRTGVQQSLADNNWYSIRPIRAF